MSREGQLGVVRVVLTLLALVGLGYFIASLWRGPDVGRVPSSG